MMKDVKKNMKVDEFTGTKRHKSIKKKMKEWEKKRKGKENMKFIMEGSEEKYKSKRI